MSPTHVKSARPL